MWVFGETTQVLIEHVELDIALTPSVRGAHLAMQLAHKNFKPQILFQVFFFKVWGSNIEFTKNAERSTLIAQELCFDYRKLILGSL